MKKTLYLMRHGETLFNRYKKIQGWCDSPLTERGKQQALIAKDYFIQQGITFDSAYASTSERASDTLELITSQPYQRIKGIKEWNFGIFEGEPEYLNPSLPYGDFFVPYGGEEELAFRQRVAETLQNLMKAEKGATVLAVSHGASCRQFMRAWEHISQYEGKVMMTNCCILKFSYDTDTEVFQLEEIVNHDFSMLEEV